MFNVGDLISINPELCPTSERENNRFQFGSLNYPVFQLAFEMEVVRVFKDDYHGQMLECRVTNQENIRSNCVVKAADAIFAIKNVSKMVFEIIGQVSKFQTEIDALRTEEKTLIAFRAKLKTNKLVLTDAQMKSNWTSIKSLRAKLAILNAKPEKVFQVKHRTGLYTLDCKEDQITSKLRRLIASKRNENRKINTSVRQVEGGLMYETQGGVLVAPNKFLELHEKLAITVIKQHKVPTTTTDNFVGIEIEMLSPKSIGEMEKVFIKSRLQRFVNVGADVSIKADIGGFNPMELRICLPESLLESHLKLICEVLRKNNCYTNKSCGMHVHLDMRSRDPELAYRNLFKVQDIMLQSQPEDRRSNRYAMPNKTSNLRLKDFDGPKGDSQASQDFRRQAINTQSYNKNNMRTIEIRVHEGATKFKDVYNWVKFLVGTVSLTTDLEKTVTNLEDLVTANYLESKVISHLHERILEYSA